MKPPSSDLLGRLGAMAGDPDCWFFWEQAGVHRSDVMRAVPDLAVRLDRRPDRPVIEVQAARGATKAGDALALKRRPDAVAVPLLRDAAAAGSPRMIEEAAVEKILVIPRDTWPPGAHPDDTVCVRIAGDSMLPILDDGYMVAIDTREQDRRDLYGKMVAARDPEGGVTIKWLRREGPDEMLVPQHTSPRHPVRIISRDQRWKIIGPVVWWIGWPPK